MSIFDLPFPIFLIIKEYINIRDFKMLISTCASDYFLEIRKKTVEYDLDFEHSLLFVSNKRFREKILENVERKEKQVSLCLANEGISNRKIKNYVKHLQGLKALALSKLLDFMKLPDFSIFNGIEELSIDTSFYTNNFLGLIDMKKIAVRNFPKLTDVSDLRSLDTVILINCPLLQDINSLGNVRCLQISVCRYLEDEGIQGLGLKNEEITFSGIPGITSLDHLKSISALSLKACGGIRILNDLPNLTYLSVCNCESIFQITNLPKLKTSKIEGCELLSNFQSFQNISDFTLAYAYHLANYQSDTFRLLNSLVSLTLSYIFIPLDINFLSTLSTLKSLHILCAPGIIFDINLFGSLEKISIKNSHKVISIQPSLSQVKTLTFENCSSLSCIEGLSPGNRTISLQACRVQNLFPIRYCKHAVLQIADFHSSSRSFSLEKLFRKKLQQKDVGIYSDLSTAEYLHLNNLQSLLFYWCSIPLDFSFLLSRKQSFISLEVLVVQYCSHIVSLHGLQNIPVLLVDNCHRLQELYPITKKAKHSQIVLRKCPLIDDMESLSDVRVVSISCCDRILDLTPLSQVERIEYERSDNLKIPKPKGLTKLHQKIWPFRGFSYQQYFPGVTTLGE